MTMTIICFDHGDRYVGVAVTDGEGTVALRHSVLDGKQVDSLKEAIQIATGEGAEQVLVGVPMSLAGEETEQTHKALAFIEQLRAALGAEVEIEGVDETLTSKEASQRIKAEMGKPEDEHAEAARLILVHYLKRKQASQSEAKPNSPPSNYREQT